MINRFSLLPRTAKSLVILASDVLVFPFVFWLSVGVRLDVWMVPFDGRSWWIYLVPSLIAAPVFLRAGLYRSVIRYIEERAIFIMLSATTVAVLLFCAIVLSFKQMPLGVLFIFWILATAYVCGSRFLARALLRQHTHVFFNQKRVIIYGAGSAGIQLANALRSGKEYSPVAFIDDEPNLHGLMLSGLRVCAPADIMRLRDEGGVTGVLLALPSTTRAKRVEIINRLEPLHLKVRALPGMVDLVEGQVSLSDIKDVGIDELLGRDVVPANQALLSANVVLKNVMVTGAGGSIGSELCRQILANKPDSLVLYEISEFALYSIEAELKKQIQQQGLTTQLLPVLGSVRDGSRLQAVMKRYAVHTVYHAAAYKHVPLVEFNITEGVLNNTLGTWMAANAAVLSGVETFVLISTDKAVRPTNVMGATKRMAELGLQALAANGSTATKFSMVRFGNVLGSSGSVVPLFRKQIAEGGPVTVTHPEIIRYFMTIPEAAQLVIQAGAMGGQGEVFVLDMGQPVKIVDLAVRMIHLSGCSVRCESNLDGDIAIQFTGLRPGEKLYEELLIGDDVLGTSHPKIMKASEGYIPLNEFKPIFEQLALACAEYDCVTILQLLQKHVAGFKPDQEIRDHLLDLSL